MPTNPYIRLRDERTAAGENASSLIPQRVLAIQRNIRETRHVGAGWAASDPTLEFSTHPRAWWGTPLIVPTYPGATTLNVAISVKTTGANGQVRLGVAGRYSNPATVTAGAGFAVSTLSIPLPSVAAPTDVYATIEFQSGLGTAASTVTIQGGEGNDLFISGAGTGGAPAVQHIAFRAPDGDGADAEEDQWHEGYYYAGTLLDGIVGHGYRVWPAVSASSWIIDGGKAAPYPLARFVVDSYAMWLSGVDTRDMVPIENVRPDATIYSADLQALNLENAQLLESRRPIALTTHFGGVFGARRYSTIASPHALSGELEAVALAAPWVDSTETVTEGYTDLPFEASTGASDEWPLAPPQSPPDAAAALGSAAMFGDRSPGGWGRTSVQSEGTLGAFGSRLHNGAWGGRDLLHLAPGPSDLQRLTPVRTRWTPSGDVSHVWVGGTSTSPGALLVYAGQVREVRVADRSMPGTTAVLPGEIVRGVDNAANGEGIRKLPSDAEDLRTECLRMLWSSSLAKSTVVTAASGVVIVDRVLIRTSDDTAGQFRCRAVAVNADLTFGIYTLAGSLVVEVSVPSTDDLDFVELSADGTGLSSDTTYRVKITAGYSTAPGGATPNGAVQSLSIQELL